MKISLGQLSILVPKFGLIFLKICNFILVAFIYFIFILHALRKADDTVKKA